MKLLGERNWYLPRRLQWLPQIELESPVGRTPSAAADADDASATERVPVLA
jgi:hypothetical protein